MIHPGANARERVARSDTSKTEIAYLLGTSRQTIYNLLNKTMVTPNIALRLAKLTGTTPESWLNLQNEYDLLTADEKLKDDVARIPTLTASE